MSTPETALNGSPHQLEQNLENAEAEAAEALRFQRVQNIARSVGSQALRYITESGRQASANLRAFYGWAAEAGSEAGTRIEGNIRNYYGSVPESIKNLDLTTGAEVRQASIDEGSNEDTVQDKTESVEGETSPPEEEPSDEDDEPIEEDTADNWDASSEARNAVNGCLREAGIDDVKVDKVNRILDYDREQLVHLYLRNAGVEEKHIPQIAHLLAPVNLYLKKLEGFGLPKDKAHEAQHFLTEEVGRLRLKHLMGLVGSDKEAELRRLMSTHRDDLLTSELKIMGIEEDKAQEIIATPHRNKTQLTQEALEELGLSEDLIDDIEVIMLKAEIPEDLAAEADDLGIPLETLVKAREAFKRAEWRDTFDYLKIAMSNEGAREKLREHGIEIEPLPETEESKKAKLAELSLKEIHKEHPEEWEAERARRVAVKRRELAEMLRKFRAYLPLEDLPLPADVEVDPEMEIPQNPEDDHHIGRAYGVWRRLLTNSYVKRINDPNAYKSVRAELHRVGGPIPILRNVRQRLLAIRILNSEKRARREVGDRANYGTKNVGIKRYKEIFRTIEQADIEVKDARRALGFWNKNNFVADNQATPRDKLAENIIDIRLREIAFRDGRLNPVISRYQLTAIS